MLASKFDRKITIEKKQKSINTVGTPVYDFYFLKFKQANVDYRGGTTTAGNFAERTHTDATFTIRYDSEVNYNCRIVYNNSVYQIDHIEIVGRNIAMRIRCIMLERNE